MKKYMLSAVLLLSDPQLIMAEPNIATPHTQQQLNIVDDWLAYQKFASQATKVNEEYQKKFETSSIDDLDERYAQMKIDGQQQNKILVKMLEALHPHTPEFIEIQKLWLDVLHSEIKAVDDKHNTDDNEISTKLEKISALNSNLEAQVFHFIQQQNPPEYVTDWIHYKQLKRDIEQKRNALNQSFSSLFKQANQQNKIKLQQQFIQKITRTELEMLRGFKTHVEELKHIIDLEIQATQSAEKMNLNAVLNASLNIDEMNDVGEISEQIEKQEHLFASKIVDYVRSL